MQIVTAINAPECPILNLFIDWNPVYDENWRGLERAGRDNMYKYKEGE